MNSVFDTRHLYRSYFKMAFPVVLGLVVSLIYNLADTFFIAQTNDTNLIAGVSLCSPVFTTLMAFGNIYGQGGSSLISRLLGQNDTESVRRVSSFCFYIALVTGLVLAVLMSIFNHPILMLLGADSATLPHAFDYYIVLVICAPVIVLSFIHSNLVRCEGMATYSMRPFSMIPSGSSCGKSGSWRIILTKRIPRISLTTSRRRRQTRSSRRSGW